MSGKQLSGYCRTTALIILILLALCVTAASAATLNSNLVASKVTLAPVTTATPAYVTCPAGYDCMTLVDAAAQLGTYAKYSDAICGYKQSTATLAAVVRIPQYCVKKTEPQNPAVCPEGCSCMMESAAKDKYQGVYKKCGDKPCNTVVTGAAQVSAYCFGPGTTTTTPTPAPCGEGCSCISEATAKAKGGSWSRCSGDNICGYEQSTATLAAVVQVPKYCMKLQETTPVCPEGCSCISDADAKLKGLTTKCNPNENPCGYQSVAGTANTQANRIPLYCYKMGITVTPTPQVCKEGCYCLQEAAAKEKFGPNNYQRCQSDICGYDQSAASANGIPRYCFSPLVTVTPTPPVCPEGCTCTTNATAVEKGLTFCGGKLTSCGYNENKQPLYCFVGPGSSPTCPQGCLCTTDEIAKEKGLTTCRGTRTSCGYNENKQPLYCFEQVPSPTCVYDYQKNVCAGTCQQGYACGLLASEKDATGKVTYAVCGCTGQPTTVCAYDAQKNACTGTCQTGAACAIVGKKVDEKTGETTVVCGCPQSSSCTYNYDKNACVGSCTVTGEACQLNTIYRDPTTGKVTYAECHCKGGGETTPTCACDAASGYCTGNCADGKACMMTATATDNAGKNICTKCECKDTCVLTANNECSGTCLTGEPCARMVTKDDSGQEKVSCVCGGSQPGTPAGVAPRPQGIFEAIASFFSKLFGGK